LVKKYFLCPKKSTTLSNFLFLQLSFEKQSVSKFIMELVATISAASAAAIGSELLVGALVRKCVLSKMNTVSDQLISAMFYLTKMGFNRLPATTATSHKSASTKHHESIFEHKQNVNLLQMELQGREEYQELMRLNLSGQIEFISSILNDRKKLMCKDHKVMETSATALTDLFIPNYSEVKSQNANAAELLYDDECNSPMCNCETLNTAIR
jgi:hypothetical protein